MLLEVAIQVFHGEHAELGVNGDDAACVPRAVSPEVDLDNVAHAEGVEGVSKLDADCVQPLAGHVRLEIAVVVQNVDCAVLAVNGEDLSRVKHAPPRPISTHVVAHLKGLWHSAH